MLRRVLLLGAAGALLTPSAALAATYTVDGAAADGCNGTTCRTLDQANDKLADGDTIQLKQGFYVENSAVNVTKANITIKATPNTAIISAKSTDANAGKPVITLAAGGTIDGLTVGAGANQGAAIALGASGKVLRSTLLATNSASSGLTITAAPGATTALTAGLDSSIIIGGSAAPGLAATSAASAVQAAPAVTVAASSQAMVLNAAGAVAVTLDRSIVHGSGKSTTAATAPTLGTAAAVSIAIKNSDTTDTSAGGVTVTGGQSNSDAALFADPGKFNYHLRVNSPAIDKGGPQGSGESDTDVDGQPRVNGSASDLGADEFVNAPPVARLTVSPTTVVPGQTVSFDASASTDPDAGGGIPTYAISFGDGGGYVGGVPGATHAYVKPGVYLVRAAVLDNLGTPSQIAATTVIVRDVTAPLVAITSPAPSKRFALLTKTKKVRQISIAGTASDLSGIGRVELSIKRISVTKTKAKAKAKKKKTTAKKSQSSCTFLLDGKASFGAKSCSKPAFFTIATTQSGFAYKTKSSTAFKRGVYEVTARATDIVGNVATSTPVRFRLT